MDSPETTPTPSSEVIVCPVTPWFYKRMGITFVFMLAFGLYFFYDGVFGYPKENERADKKDWFDNVYLKSYADEKAAGRLNEWIAKWKAEGMPTGENDEPPKWVTYTAQKGWPEETKRRTPEEIAQQFHWGWGLIIGDVLVLVWVLMNRKKTLVGYLDHMVMPSGRTVRYADVFKVDKRKWDNKGLAYVYHRQEGREGRVTVDDLKFGGADRVLNRLLQSFTGELIEKAPEVEEEKDDSADSKSGGDEGEKAQAGSAAQSQDAPSKDTGRKEPS